jgi:hypothetical protein
MTHSTSAAIMPQTKSPRKPNVVPVRGNQIGEHRLATEPSTIVKINRRLVADRESVTDNVAAEAGCVCLSSFCCLIKCNVNPSAMKTPMSRIHLNVSGMWSGLEKTSSNISVLEMLRLIETFLRVLIVLVA